MSATRGIRFFPFAGRRVAYGLSGSGPLLVAPAWWVSHLELDWQNPRFRRFWEATGDGLPAGPLRPARRRALGPRRARPRSRRSSAKSSCWRDDARRARLRARDARSAAPPEAATAIAFAARFPHRVERLLLYGTFADGVRDRARRGPRRRSSLRCARTGGSDRGCSRTCSSATKGALSASSSHRPSATPATPRPRRCCWNRSTAPTSARSSGSVSAPTVIVHRRADRAIPYELGRRVAAGIEQAALRAARGERSLPVVRRSTRR